MAGNRLAVARLLESISILPASSPAILQATIATRPIRDCSLSKAHLDKSLKLNELLAQADYLKDELRQFWQQPSKTIAAKFLDDWCRRAEASGIRVLRTISHTLCGHRVGLLNWYDQPISASPLEGNTKIGLLQRRAYSYRRYKHFKLQLPTRHRT